MDQEDMVKFNLKTEREVELYTMLDREHRVVKELDRKFLQRDKEHQLEIKTLRYAVAGACAANIDLTYRLDSNLLRHANQAEFLQFLCKNTAKRIAVDVEEQLGGRYELLTAYDEAKKHIFYLENHAAAHLIPFTTFLTRELTGGFK